MKIDWKRKLSSRKLWVAVAGLVSSTLIFFGHPESEATQVSAIIMQTACVIGYIVGEGLIDHANAGYEYGGSDESDDDD